jgi:2-polyprenyl-6-methoxyphenol hydroxylase-like FAD-dependent oxidoreductase
LPLTLRAFEESRRARAADMVNTSRQIGRLGLGERRVVCRARDLMMRAFFDRIAMAQSYSLMMDRRLERGPVLPAARAAPVRE